VKAIPKPYFVQDVHWEPGTLGIEYRVGAPRQWGKRAGSSPRNFDPPSSQEAHLQSCDPGVSDSHLLQVRFPANLRHFFLYNDGFRASKSMWYPMPPMPCVGIQDWSSLHGNHESRYPQKTFYDSVKAIRSMLSCHFRNQEGWQTSPSIISAIGKT